MNVIDHGKWAQYVPASVREGVPINAMFSRRESDGKDWYEFLGEEPFIAGTVKITAAWHDNVAAWIAGAATDDATKLFPQNAYVIEVTDYAGSDPQLDFGGQAYDPAVKTFYPAPPLPAPENSIMALLETIVTRLDRLEKRP
jgi:hypothetical protein